MPNITRIVVSGYPHHVVQRGHNKQPIFTSEASYRLYLRNLREWKERLGCRVYAYCLMTNHVHLIVDPGEDAKNLAALMKRVAGRQTRYINKTSGRTGTLWESRYKSSVIDTDEYLMACCRYVELNPVRAGIAADAADYQWSSYRAKIGCDHPSWIDADPCYISLAETAPARAERYREWMDASVPEGEWQMIRETVRRGKLTGDAAFTGEIERKTRKRVEARRRGRPRKEERNRGE